MAQTSYALYLSKFVDAYAARGVNVTAVMVQNEPYAGGCNYPKCQWTGEQMRAFVRDYLGPRFAADHAAGSPAPAEVWLGTLNTDDFAEAPYAVLSDLDAAAQIGGVALQWAGKGIVGRVARTWPSLKVGVRRSERE